MENSCYILELNEENICNELKEFIQPWVSQAKDSLNQPACGGRKGWKRFETFHPDLAKLSEFSKLSNEAKQQYYDHCNRMRLQEELIAVDD